MFKEMAEELAKSKVEALANVQAAAFEVTVSADASPNVVFAVEERVVNAPVLGVPEPMVPGIAQVFPIKEDALMVPVPA